MTQWVCICNLALFYDTLTRLVILYNHTQLPEEAFSLEDKFVTDIL